MKQPIEGNDGRLYFNYGIGAEFAYTNTDGTVSSIKIVDCFYAARENMEKYAVEVKGYVNSWSIKRLENWLRFTQAEEVTCGTAAEYPLLKEEVTAYVEDQRNERNRARVAAKQYMEKTTGYTKLCKEQAELERLFSRAITDDSPNALELKAKYQAKVDERRRLIISKGIDITLFEPDDYCPYCDGAGVTKFGICHCARAKEDEIKRFNAAKRLSRRLGKEWATYSNAEPASEAGGQCQIDKPAPRQIEA